MLSRTGRGGKVDLDMVGWMLQAGCESYPLPRSLGAWGRCQSNDRLLYSWPVAVDFGLHAYHPVAFRHSGQALVKLSVSRSENVEYKFFVLRRMESRRFLRS